MMNSISEKRRFPRLDSVHLVSYTQLDEDHNPVDMGICKSLDLSLGGVTIETHRTFPVNTGLEMVIAIEERLVRLRGRVVHQREVGEGKHEIGVCFTEVDEEDRAAIQDFFQKISSK
jgi:c-di-GMP-binding flagellar brake protein YcgR